MIPRIKEARELLGRDPAVVRLVLKSGYSFPAHSIPSAMCAWLLAHSGCPRQSRILVLEPHVSR